MKDLNHWSLIRSKERHSINRIDILVPHWLKCLLSISLLTKFMCCIWDIAIRTPSLLPLYVPFEHFDQLWIQLGPPPAFGTISHIPVFFFSFFEGIPNRTVLSTILLVHIFSPLKQFHTYMIRIIYRPTELLRAGQMLQTSFLFVTEEQKVKHLKTFKFWH